MPYVLFASHAHQKETVALVARANVPSQGVTVRLASSVLPTSVYPPVLVSARSSLPTCSCPRPLLACSGAQRLASASFSLRPAFPVVGVALPLFPLGVASLALLFAPVPVPAAFALSSSPRVVLPASAVLLFAPLCCNLSAHTTSLHYVQTSFATVVPLLLLVPPSTGVLACRLSCPKVCLSPVVGVHPSVDPLLPCHLSCPKCCLSSVCGSKPHTALLPFHLVAAYIPVLPSAPAAPSHRFLSLFCATSSLSPWPCVFRAKARIARSSLRIVASSCTWSYGLLLIHHYIHLSCMEVTRSKVFFLDDPQQQQALMCCIHMAVSRPSSGRSDRSGRAGEGFRQCNRSSLQAKLLPSKACGCRRSMSMSRLERSCVGRVCRDSS